MKEEKREKEYDYDYYTPTAHSKYNLVQNTKYKC
jgi:hypothetical protein